ncbi:hypothetical protein [Natrialbaceae archaeon AArc-T1-2]|uniref:hypothetical protein n=1 Tax=Natrialbaceae archaeon AArc-T1-2 TaxID=3053904 RepID=UPI00255AD1ED|nr:hypothetical protein [Natrialbaceae archaeon AArc-T1-2]WIV67250.1 hypothetical protein QQ977_00565 [Natrialbaceae archaeon AArc-T1-2]
MNHLAPAGDQHWNLPKHAHIVVYERDDGGLLTIYDCGVAQKPPSAQLLGTLETVDASAEIDSTPTGRVVSMRERSVLEEVGANRYRIVSQA